jgi:hypothetical protein
MTDVNDPEGQNPTGEGDEAPQRGSMRFQDENTAPRELSLAEQRARRQAIIDENEREAAESEAAEVAERKAGTKRKILIGSGVTVGLVGLIATFYTVAKPDEVTAVCTDNSDTVVADQQCDPAYLQSQGAVYNQSTGFWVMPLFLGGHQYRYNYGGSGAIGSHVSGGSFTAPSSHSNVSTKSGTSVQRGGFGIGKSSSGGSSGGDSGKTGGTGGTGKSGGS